MAEHGENDTQVKHILKDEMKLCAISFGYIVFQTMVAENLVKE